MLRAYAPVLYVLSIAGLVAVLSPLGSTIKGAHSWIVLPAGFSIQPSEFAKVALVVGVSMLLAEKREGRDAPGSLDVLQVLALTAVPVVLVLLQPDLGTVMVMVFLVLGILAVSGAPSKWIVGLLLAGVVGGFFAVQAGVLEDYQVKRLTAFADPTADPRGAGYNTQQARIAIGSGGLWGTGLLEGRRRRAASSPSSRPTSCSPSRGRSSASSARGR
jgi:rod shape determining protein RodA